MDMDKDQALNGWCRKIPRSGSGRPLSRKQLTEFYQMCHQLIQLHDAPITHRVITELASEGGLFCVAELVKLTELSLKYVPFCAMKKPPPSFSSKLPGQLTPSLGK